MTQTVSRSIVYDYITRACTSWRARLLSNDIQIKWTAKEQGKNKNADDDEEEEDERLIWNKQYETKVLFNTIANVIT